MDYERLDIPGLADDGTYKAERPPKGMTVRSKFWDDHLERLDECTCVINDYRCLLGDALFYAGSYDMPGYEDIIRSARSVVNAFKPGGAVYKHGIDHTSSYSYLRRREGSNDWSLLS